MAVGGRVIPSTEGNHRGENKMTRNGMAAYAAGNCQSNDIEDTDDMTDFLSEKVVGIVRILIPDEGIRAVVLADAFAKCYVDDLYTGDVFEDIEDAKDMIGELVAGHIIDNDPMPYRDFCEVCGDEDHDDEPFEDNGPFDDCDRNLCDDDCNHCQYRDDIPRYVFEDGLIRRIKDRRGSDD